MQCARLLHKVLKCAAKFTAGSYSHNICRAPGGRENFPSITPLSHMPSPTAPDFCPGSRCASPSGWVFISQGCEGSHSAPPHTPSPRNTDLHLYCCTVLSTAGEQPNPCSTDRNTETAQATSVRSLEIEDSSAWDDGSVYVKKINKNPFALSVNNVLRKHGVSLH